MEVFSIKIGDAGYPQLLREISDSPEKLNCIGDLEVLSRPCVAIVGTRKSTPYGEALAFQFARELSLRGVCVVSGLAYGIDAAAHKGALEGKGGTIAIMAQALPEIRPAGHSALAKRIVDSGGLLLSEKESGKPTLRHDYLVRNRLISGVSSGVLVVEAGFRSGALNTANHALDQNRDVMAIPGRITDEKSTGCNRLIFSGAQMIRSAKEVAEFLGFAWQELDGAKLEGELKVVFEMIKAKPMTGPELGEHYEGRLKELYSVLSELELRGLIRRSNGMRYAACSGGGGGA